MNEAFRFADAEERVAIYDLGSNSLRMDVWRLPQRGAPELLLREKAMVRLGDGVFESGHLSAKAMQRALTALTLFHHRAVELGVEKELAYATAAMRHANAGSRLAFRRHVRHELGLNLKVISGQEEARLIALGALKRETHLPAGGFALMDIGGGSTEVSLARGRKVIKSISLPLGANQLQQSFLREQPPHWLQLKAAREQVAKILKRKLKGWQAGAALGSSGTIRAAQRLALKAGRRLDINFLGEMNARMSVLTRKEIHKSLGIEKKRLDLILAGAIILEELLKHLGCKALRHTPYALRDGIFEDERENWASAGR